MRDAELIFKKYYPRLCAFAIDFLEDKEDAEDIVQDVFKVYLEKNNIISTDELAIKSFLYSSVKNACLNKFRHQKVKDKYCQVFAQEEESDSHGLDNIIHAEIVGSLYEAINELPKGCAIVIRMGYLEGLKNPQIAETLGISINTVKTQKQRGLTLLRQKLGETAILCLMLLS